VWLSPTKESRRTSVSLEPRDGLAFTRYCFTLKLYCESLSFFCCPPQTANAYPIAILLHTHCAIYTPPPTLPLNAIHHTILVMAISCKGQGTARGCVPRRGRITSIINRYIHIVKTRRWECDRSGSRTHVLWVHDWGPYH